MFRASDTRSIPMLDLLYIALGLGCFGLMAGYATALNKL